MISISECMVRSVMNRYTLGQMEWRYEHGLVLESIFLLGQLTGQEEFCCYVENMYAAKISAEGEILGYREDEYNLDHIKAGKTLFLLHEKYGGDKYLSAIESLREQLRKHPRTKAGGFWHKLIYPWQMWLDGLYMMGPFYAQYAAKISSESSADFDDIVHQFVLAESKTRDEETGLLYHAWDESCQQKWANPHTGCSPHFWSRAIGWYCMALVDTIELIPASFREKAAILSNIAQRLLKPVFKYQDAETGLWYQVMDKGGEDRNYTESSASSMFVYFFLKMLKLGLVPDADAAAIKAAAIRAYKGLLEHKIYEDADKQLHLSGICMVAGLGKLGRNPYRDGSYDYYVSEPIVSDDFKGVGPFILASIEYEQLDHENLIPAL